MPQELWWTLGLLPFAYFAGYAYKRWIRGGTGFTMKQQLKHLAVAAVIFLVLMVIAGIASGDTPQKPPPLAGAARSGHWRFSQKEIALPGGPLCTSHAVIIGRHVTLKVAGAQMFEATVALTRPQHKRGNVVSVYVDNAEAEVESVAIQFGQPPHVLRIPLPPGAQTLMEQRPFPSLTYCNIKLS